MAALNFPNSPSVNDLHTENGVTFKWNGTIWKRVSSAYTDTTNLNVTGIGTIAGNFHVGGVLTYEDVKNVDSVGIISARTAVHVGAGISAVGIITGTSFRGDGSQLTGITQVGGATTVGFDDNKPIYFGSQDDYKMYWNGTRMYLEPTSTSTTQILEIKSNDQMYINSKDQGLFLMSGNQHVIDIYGGGGGGVYFKHNNSQKLKLEGGNWTYLNGATVTHAGDVFIPDKIVHTGDTNTAIRFPSADTITAETGGSERLRITSTGDIGINCTPHSNAGINLQIHGDNTTSEIRLTNTTTGNGNNGGTIQMGGNTLYISNTENGNTVFENNGSERLRITSSGDLLLGTTTTYAATGTGNMMFSVKKDATSRTDASISNQSSGDNASAALVLATHGQDYILEATGSGNTTDSVRAFRILKGTSERYRITSSGTHVFGGNTAAPIVDNGELLYRGNSTQTFESLPQSFYLYGDSLGSGSANAGTGMVFGGNYKTDGTITTFAGIHGIKENTTNNEYGGALVFGVRQNGSSSWERLRIDSSGNMGLGTGSGIDRQFHIQGTHPIIKLEDTGGGYSEISANTAVLSLRADQGNSQSSSYINFQVDGGEKWRIDSSGHFRPSSNDAYDVGTNQGSQRINRVYSNYWIHRNGNSNGISWGTQEFIGIQGGFHFFHDNVTLSTSNFTHGACGNRSYDLMRLRNSGSGSAIYAENGSISSGSDYRMKENVAPITGAIDMVKNLKPCTYNIKKSFNEHDAGGTHQGFIAHEVQEAIPNITNIVQGTKDAMEEVRYMEEDENIPTGKKPGDGTGVFTDKPDMQGIDYGHMTPVLCAALKEAIAEIETLKAEVAALKSS